MYLKVLAQSWLNIRWLVKICPFPMSGLLIIAPSCFRKACKTWCNLTQFCFVSFPWATFLWPCLLYHDHSKFFPASGSLNFPFILLATLFYCGISEKPSWGHCIWNSPLPIVTSRIPTPYRGPQLNPYTCDYAMVPGKSELRLKMESRLLISLN